MASLNRALVIGGSMSGLLAASVLSNHCREVAVLERDVFPAVGENRKGVPQGRHAHALLGSGLSVLEGFFSGLTEELVAQGGAKTDISRVRWFDNGGYHARCTGLEALLVSRPRLEAHVRQRLLALPNVQIRENCTVESLLTDAEQTRVTGVRVIDSGSQESLQAELVVDASGRGSRSPTWLEALTYPKPSEERVEINVGYRSLRGRRTGIGRIKIEDRTCHEPIEPISQNRAC